MQSTAYTNTINLDNKLATLLNISDSKKFGYVIAALSCLCITIYVFLLCPYQDFLVADAEGYWHRAISRFKGNVFGEDQFIAWPPIYHILLAECFRMLQFLGLHGLLRLETPLMLNIMLYSVSVYAMQRITGKWLGQSWLTIAVVLLYALGFPALYFQAFLLPDNPAASLLVISLACIYCRDSWKWLLISAAIFGVASAIRPAVAPYGLAFIIYLFLSYKFNIDFLKRAAAFTALFFAVISFAALEVSRISHGKINGLSGNAGLDFFIANSRVYGVLTEYNGWGFLVVVPALSWHPENGMEYTNVPFYKQEYYYKLGLEHIKHDPLRLVKNFEHIRDLFFAVMMPTRLDAPGFALLIPLWDKFKLLMLIGIISFIWFWPSLKREHLPLFGFLTSTILITFIVSYLFTGEPRYTYSIIFCFYLLFFKLIELLQLNWTTRYKQILPVTACSALCVLLIGTAPAMLEPDYPATIITKVKPHKTEHIQATAGLPPFEIGRAVFPTTEHVPLKYIDNEFVAIHHPSTVTLNTNFTIAGNSPLSVLFSVNSTWPAHLFIDGEERIYVENHDFFLDQRVEVYLEPGQHTLTAHFNYSPVEGGFALGYSYVDTENWQHRQSVGVSDGRIQFSLPKNNY